MADIAAARWFVARTRKKHGPFSWKQLQALAQRGRLRPGDMLLREGERRWVEAASVPNLFPSARPRPAPVPTKPRRRWIGIATVVFGVLLMAGALGWWAFWRPMPAKDAVAGVKPPPPAPTPEPPPQQEPPPSPKQPEPAAKTPEPERPTVEKKPALPTEQALAEDLLRRLNAQRVLAGAGEVRADAELSRGCVAHARYLARHLGDKVPDAESVRAEDPALPGFSEEGRRAAQASLLALSEPREALSRWLARLNSRVPLLNPELQAVGIGFAPATGGGWYCVLDVTRGRGDPVVIFPAPGQVDVPLTFSGGSEVPDPEAHAGFPVTVSFPETARVTGVEARLQDDAGKVLDVWLSTPEKPARPRGQRNTVALIAKAPLRNLCTYHVDVRAELDGRAWQKRWEFITEDDSDSSGAWARKALERVNAYRAKAGQSPVTLDAELSRGCLAHARYLARNGGHPATLGLGAHDEDASLPGFSEEGRKAGKASDIAIGDYDPLFGLDSWMATFYHRIPLLEPHLKTIGFGCARGRRLSWIAVLNAGTGREPGKRPTAFFYPAPGQNDVPLHFPSGGEEPNPIPEDTDGKAGYPVTATFPHATPLTDARAILRDDNGNAVPCWFSSPEKLANPKYPNHQGTTVCLIPKDPLAPATTYHVELQGILGGKAWQKDWQFTTAGDELSPAQAALQVVARLNEFRKQAGVPAVTLDAELSRGCQAHADYLVRNSETLARKNGSVNDEDPALPGFTPQGLRASKQSDVFTSAPYPLAQLDDLVGTFLRRVYLLDPNLRRIGFGCADDVGRGWRCVLDLIGGRGDRRVVVCPGPQQEGVPCSAADHLPDAPDQPVGFPITVTFSSGQAVRNVQAILTDTVTRDDVELTLSTPEAPLTPQAPRGTVALYPRRPLQAGHAYRVTVSAIVAGSEWRQAWQFTTAADK